MGETECRRLALWRQERNSSNVFVTDTKNKLCSMESNEKVAEKSRPRPSGVPEDPRPSADEHREITVFLTERNGEFHAIDLNRGPPPKIVIKGLPDLTDIDAIRVDLTERGFNVLKVAQLTKAKSKPKLPILW
ncbi:hypothetical protein TNCV_3082361 [Trichonephila clavipes]|nr:hypothetical protein TNCV_3082361 [Trichonephila clavipes]